MLRSVSTTEFRCPTCGAESALRLPDSQSRAQVTLKCLVCASLVRLPEKRPDVPDLPGAGGAGGSI